VRRELLGRWILPIRLVPLALGFGYILILHGSLDPTPADWALTICSTGLIVFQGRWPLVVTLLQAALVVGFPAFQLGQGVATMASLFALGELSWRRGGWQMWLGAVAVFLAGFWRPLMGGLVPELFASAVTTCLPVLLGMHLRSVQQIAWQAKQRAAIEAENARADERTAIARELHDLVAHHVASMVLRIGVARHVLNPDPAVAQVLDEVHESGKAAMADLRTLVTVLRSSKQMITMDLLASLNDAVERVEAAGPTVQTSIDAEVANLDAVLRLAILRVVQESLTNVLKHSAPEAKVSLEIRLACGAVEVSLDDAGPRRSEPAEPGHGLIGMRERVELIGGKLVAGPSGVGWQVRAWLPA
jgi:signal transduction histidine kinase